MNCLARCCLQKENAKGEANQNSVHAGEIKCYKKKPWETIFEEISTSSSTWMLHYDTAATHTSLLFCNFFAKSSTVIIAQPSDLFLFLKLKRPMKEKREFCYD